MKRNDKFFIYGLAALLCALSAPGAHAQATAVKDQPAALDTDSADDAAPAAEVSTPASSVPIGFAGNYLSGMFARSSGDIQSAIHFLRSAHNRAPADVNVESQLQGLLLLDGQMDEAIALADKIHASGKKDPVSDLLLTLRAIKKNNNAEAARIVDSSFATGNGQLWQPLISAWLDVGKGALKKPLKLEELSANVGRAAGLANYHLGVINNQAGFKDEAALNFKSSIEDAENPPSHLMEALLSFYRQNNEPAALTSVVSAYRAANPDSELQGDTKLPSTVAEGVAEVLFTMGSVMLEADVTQDATIYLRMALYLQPDFGVAALTLGDAYSELEQYARANEIYGLIARDKRLYLPAQLRTVLNLDRMDRKTEALLLLDRLGKQLPKQYETMVVKGDLLRVRSRYPEAIEAYSQAIKRIPELTARHWPVFFARGACYERVGKWTLSERDMQQALKLKPDEPEVLNYLGYSWLTRGEHVDEARAMLEKALKARPNDGQIVDSMGWALYLQGEYTQAANFVEKALQLLPSDPTVNDHLGDVYWRQGRTTEARYQWERALTYSPERAEADAIGRKLKDGLPPDPKAEKPPVVASSQPDDKTTTP